MTAMEKDTFTTPQGPVWLWRTAAGADDRRPVVLALHGAFSIAQTRLHELPGLLPEADVRIGFLPGNNCPHTAEQTVAAYAAAYDAVIQALGRPTVVVGASVGALVALALREPLVKAVVLAEPPLLTGKLWPFVAAFRARLAEAPDDAQLRDFVWNVFGISATDWVGRDYRPLLNSLRVPAWVLHGTIPLHPPRAFDELPSLVDGPELDLLRAHPHIRLREIEGIGHNVPGRGITFVRTATRDLLNGLIESKANAHG